MTHLPWYDRVPRTRIYLKLPEILSALADVTFAPSASGTPVEHFERAFADMMGVERAVAEPYARTALYHLIAACQLPPGSELIMTPITIHDIINVLLIRGIKPVFVDIDPRTYQIDPDQLARAITPKTRAVLVTHLFGLVPDMEHIQSLCHQHGLLLLEDVSHAYNASWKGKKLGTFGDAAFFSLSSLKAVSTGYGGMAIAKDPEILQRVRQQADLLPPVSKSHLRAILYRNLIVNLATQPSLFSLFTFPLVRWISHRNPETIRKLQTDNPHVHRLHEMPDRWLWKFNDVQAKLGLSCLSRVMDWDERRRHNAHILLNQLSPVAQNRLPQLLEGSYPVFWRFPFRAPEGAKFRRFMAQHGVDLTTTLLPCCSTMPIFADIARETPHARQAVREVHFLPVHPTIHPDRIMTQAKVVLEFLGQGG
ncbi:MAG: aminotransferase class I/II-fold pyridoxal phosphate-dependent enzyme [Magnetococcales bacterium]|nr:aminotransferase class I/II-fold pyridoxal phosphate-dependent enzyme [Magnetococcales bacterium]MBF0149222.1 aminotransferase class I/II-fold pyridoxal phosphate-dependent enzyme [Magnetococcales bacterium]MBF0171988.1 aminotransferase class I/II-fold pyridoxal phosphate-dependent enzyme [Magnetococcales bacterium]